MTQAKQDQNEEAAEAQQPEHEHEKNAEIAEGLTAEDPLAPEFYPEHEDERNPEHSAQIATLQSELDHAKDKMVRAVAEAENTRKRAAKEREDARKFAISGFAKDVLSVADNLRRALEAVPDDLIESEPRLKNLTGGIEATERELLRAFEKNGITKLEPTDEKFDPNHHEVMFEAPGTGKPAGTIIQLVEPGYALEGRLLRPARVGVAKDEGSAPTEPTEPGERVDTEA